MTPAEDVALCRDLAARYRAAADRLMATRTGMTADYHERAAQILAPV